MLVLSRQINESIVIGDEIVITVVDIRGDKVRLGVEAPSSTSVHRSEVYQAIQREAEPAPDGTVRAMSPAVQKMLALEKRKLKTS